MSELDKAIEKAEREIQGWEPEYLRSGNYRAIVCDIIRRNVEPVIEAKDKRIAELEQALLALDQLASEHEMYFVTGPTRAIHDTVKQALKEQP